MVSTDERLLRELADLTVRLCSVNRFGRMDSTVPFINGYRHEHPSRELACRDSRSSVAEHRRKLLKTVARAFSLEAHAKLNLCLEVGPRQGELHAITTAIAELELSDELRFEPSGGGFHLHCDREDIAAEDNLIWRAARGLELALPDVSIRLRKNIPTQAGLGGGSADAAATLLGLARIFEESGAPLTPRQIADAALQSGSDVPSFLVNGLKIVGGVGDEVERYDCQAPPWGVLLLRPADGSSTALAYQMLDEAGVPHDLTAAPNRVRAMCSAFATHDFDRFATLLHNDFSGVIEGALPQVRSARQRLEASGARATILCGSGSCVAGFFETRTAATDAFRRVELSSGEWSAATAFHG